MSVIWPGLEAEVERRRELLLAGAGPRRPSPARVRHRVRRRLGWAVIRLGLAVARHP